MADEQQPSRAFITPPPGLLPAAPSRDELEGTDSGTRRVGREGPVFFARPPGAVPVPAAMEDAADSTVTTPPPGPRAEPSLEAGAVTWILQTPDGHEHAIPAAGLVVGRNPAVPDGWEGAALLGVLDPEKTVSKTHAALRVDHGALTVVDLASTNGTTIGAPDAPDVPVGTERGVPVASGRTIGFGSYAVRVVRS